MQYMYDQIKDIAGAGTYSSSICASVSARVNWVIPLVEGGNRKISAVSRGAPALQLSG